MKKGNRHIGSLALCCALLCSLLVLPAQAATGSVTDSGTGIPVEGAQATCQLKVSDGTWVDWVGVIDPKPGDPETSQSGIYGADYYGQNNPMYTDANGRYGWLMPPGVYRVRITAPGYEEYISQEFTVGGEEGALAPGAQVNAALTPEGSGGGDTPGGDTPGGDTPGGDTPGGDTPGGDTPGGDTPGGDTPGGNTPGGNPSGGGSSGGSSSGGSSSGGSSSGGSSSGGSSSGGSSSGGSSSPRPDTAALVKGNLPSGEVQRGSRLTLKGKNSNIIIHYTTDGAEPTRRSPVYRNPIPIEGDMTIKVAAVQNNILGSVVTYTYTLAAPPVSVPPSVPDPSPASRLGAIRPDAASIRYLKGYSNGRFCPDKAATRYEVVDALAHLVVLDQGEPVLPFTDVDPSRAYTVAQMVRAGLINGMTETSFQGTAPMTRAQLCKVLTLVLELPPSSEPTEFPDVSGHWAAPYISALTQAGHIKGYLDGSFRPDRPVTRAELAILLNRVAGRENVPEGSFLYEDLPTSFWGYQEIQNAAL